MSLSRKELAESVRRVRRARGETTTEFGLMLGVKHSSISRYESGKIAPGLISLRNLAAIAEGKDKEVILQAIREKPRYEAEFHEQAGILTESERRRILDPILMRFQRAANRTITRSATTDAKIDGSIAEIVDLWDKHHSDPDVLEHFRACAGFLKASIRLTTSKKKLVQVAGKTVKRALNR